MAADDGAYTIRVVYPSSSPRGLRRDGWVGESGEHYTEFRDHAGVFPRKVAEDLAGYWRSHGWTVRSESVDD
jgi:hypothetical protein